MSVSNLLEKVQEMKMKRDQHMTELEKIYDKCLRINFHLAKDKLDFIYLWKSVKNINVKENNVAVKPTEDLNELKTE